MTEATSESTTVIGDSFRDAVCQLLRTQHPDASPEHYINGTKIDILFTRLDFGRRERMAVECKNYESALTKTYIESKIYPKYQPLLDARAIDGLLIVSKKTLGAAAADYMRGWRNARHLTIQELEESLLGLRSYTEAIAAVRPTDDAPYVEARFEGRDGEALKNVQDWVASEGGNGLAILGGYGQGKTSLARRIAGHFAKAYLDDSGQRIPILKKLGEVVHETRLEGLLGAEFTADMPALGYQFATFDHLNQSGRLLVILDGFDEMKHAMTAGDFYSNFREFNRLLKGNSKVILLGRPNALPSDAQALVFRGLKKVAGQTVASTEFGQWHEWQLAFFNEAESRSLLANSLVNLTGRYEAAQRFSYKPSFVQERTDEVLKRVPDDLLARPVHVQLIAELAADPGFNFAGFNQYRLYDHFIRSMVERDTTQKRARKMISLADRLIFQRDLAWWAWRRVGKVQGSFLREEIPDILLAELPDGNAGDLEGKRNEYIVSTLTEEKDSGVLYFAHRSFQEFLVAEKLRLARPDPNSHVDFATHINSDIISFLNQAPDTDFIVDWYSTLPTCVGPLSADYLKFFATFPLLVQRLTAAELAGAEHIDMWTVAIASLASISRVDGALPFDELEEILHRILRFGSDDAAAVAVLALIDSQERRKSIPRLNMIVGSLIERCLNRAYRESDAVVLLIEMKYFDFAAKWLAHGVEKKFPVQGKLDAVTLEFDLRALKMLAGAQVNTRLPTILSVFGPPGINLSKELSVVDAQQAYATISRPTRRAHESFLRARNLKFSLVAYDKVRKVGVPVKARI